jgi:hypothetical protein
MKSTNAMKEAFGEVQRAFARCLDDIETLQTLNKDLTTRADGLSATCNEQAKRLQQYEETFGVFFASSGTPPFAPVADNAGDFVYQHHGDSQPRPGHNAPIPPVPTRLGGPPAVPVAPLLSVLALQRDLRNKFRSLFGDQHGDYLHAKIFD